MFFFIVSTVVCLLCVSLVSISAALLSGDLFVLHLACLGSSLFAYLLISFFASFSVHSKEDFLAFSHNAPAFLVAGSLVASFYSTGIFIGDASLFYLGVFAPTLLAALQSGGYLIGATFFGRYLRRSEATTIAEFLGIRFASKSMRSFSAVVSITMLAVYLLSITQGIGVLISDITHTNYVICVTLALTAIALITFISGEKGVLFTDTLMMTIFLSAIIVMTLYVFRDSGGLYEGVRQLTANPKTADYLSWSGKVGVVTQSRAQNLIWGVNYGLLWTTICAFAPWQASKYIMARDESTVMRSAVIASVIVFLVEVFVGLSAVLVNLKNADFPHPRDVFIWLSTSGMPTWAGLLLSTGILAAGVSSATTFISRISANFANDISRSTAFEFEDVERDKMKISRHATLIVSIIVLLIAISRPPMVFWTMLFGVGLAASSWAPVAFGSMLCKNLSEVAAKWGMVAGFGSCLALKLITQKTQTDLIFGLEPSVVGIICNVLVMCVVSVISKAKPEAVEAYEKLMVMPESERSPQARKASLLWAKIAMAAGLLAIPLLIYTCAMPYLKAIR